MTDPYQILEEHCAVVRGLAELMPDVVRVAERMTEALAGSRKILWMGNGGSAADSQHLAAEFVGRFQRERRGLASIALTTDTSVLTAVGNDYGYESIFARQVEALCEAGDVVVGLTTSGNSPNVVQGLGAARERGAYTVALTGRTGGAVRAHVDCCLCVPSQTTARIQEAHILIGHLLCGLVEDAVCGVPAAAMPITVLPTAASVRHG